MQVFQYYAFILALKLANNRIYLQLQNGKLTKTSCNKTNVAYTNLTSC